MKSKKKYIVFFCIIVLLLLCSCGKNAQNSEAVVDAALQNQMWDLFSTATSIGVYENEDETYKVVVTCTGVESAETIETAKNICLANNATIIYAYFHSDFGHITYSYENGIEKYKMTTNDKVPHVLDYDQFVICLNNGCPDFDSNDGMGYKTELDVILEEELPYISYKNAKLGMNASDYIKGTSDTLISIDNTGIVANYYLKDDDSIDYYMENNQRYIIGVSDNEISVFVNCGKGFIDEGIQVKNILSGSDINTPPYDILVDRNISLYLWRISGGYLGIYVVNVGNTSYLDKLVGSVVYISNPEYHDVLRTFMPETEMAEDNHAESTEDSHNNSQKSPIGNTINEVSDNEDLRGAVLRVYEAVCNYMNNSGELQIDFDDLRVMYENWEVVENMDLYERPLDMEEYVAMRSGQTVSFLYDEGVRLIWGVDDNTVDIMCGEE